MISNAQLWQRLRKVTSLNFVSKSHSGTGWSGFGSGTVEVTEPSSDVLVFAELGSWQQDGGKEFHFTNTFRWTLAQDRIRLEHLRFGVAHPVFLFEMQSDAAGVWREIAPHPCRDDCYRASLQLESERIFVSWLVQGPKRNEIIDYVYV